MKTLRVVAPLVLLAGLLSGCAETNPALDAARDRLLGFEESVADIGGELNEGTFEARVVQRGADAYAIEPPACFDQVCVFSAQAGSTQGTIEAVLTAAAETGGGGTYRKDWVRTCFTAQVAYGSGEMSEFEDVSCPADWVFPGGSDAFEAPVATLTN